jgi:putative ABC transport system permease protein
LAEHLSTFPDNAVRHKHNALRCPGRDAVSSPEHHWLQVGMLMAELLLNPLVLVSAVLSLGPLIAGLLFAATSPKLFLLIVKNLRRNLLRTGLTAFAIAVLVLMVTLIWTVVYALNQMTEDKAKDMKLIVAERWKNPSMMPLTHAHYLNPRMPQFLLDKRDVGPDDFMTWSFYVGTTEKWKLTLTNWAFFFVMNPDHIIPMMDDMQGLEPILVQKLKANPKGVLLGKTRLQSINRRVGERFQLYSYDFKGLDLEFEIVGEMPQGRYNDSGIMNEKYFYQALDSYFRKNGRKHPQQENPISYIWLRVRDRDTFERVAKTIRMASVLSDRPVKCQAASAAIGSWLEPYRDLIWGIKVLLVPAILGCMALVLANAIAISVRERRQEMAVLKVVGFRPRQVLLLVLGEALLVGGASGCLASACTFGFFNLVYGGVPFEIAFFPVFRIPEVSLLWGPAMGFATAFLGSCLPAWNASSVKVSEVFAKVA